MRILLLILAITGMLSCAPTLRYYTKDMHEMNGISSGDLHNIQFYLSNDIVLWRDLGKEEISISRGKIKMTEGRKVEEIVIKKGTTGVCIFSPKEDQFAVSFDSKDDTKYLVFGSSAKMNNRYVLLAKNWDKRFGQVTYGDETYNTSAESAYAYLMVDMKKAKNISKKRETIMGRKVQ